MLVYNTSLEGSSNYWEYFLDHICNIHFVRLDVIQKPLCSWTLVWTNHLLIFSVLLNLSLKVITLFFFSLRSFVLRKYKCNDHILKKNKQTLIEIIIQIYEIVCSLNKESNEITWHLISMSVSHNILAKDSTKHFDWLLLRVETPLKCFQIFALGTKSYANLSIEIHVRGVLYVSHLLWC